jgi:chorismate-pyruvate lyase
MMTNVYHAVLKNLYMKPGTLTNFFEKTGSYVRMKPQEQNRVQKKMQLVSKVKAVKKKK